MPDIFDEFVKQKDYLICIDSDGCAIDTMDIKHIRCFGPCMIREWELEPWQEEVQEYWNAINLYTMTRGINRFKGLGIALSEADKRYKKIEGLAALMEWIDSASELSNENLEQACEKSRIPILEKALNWSNAVNHAIALLPEEEKTPFDGVEAGIIAAHQKADIAVVSSANQSAIIEEWEKYHLLQYTDIVLSQDAGSKAYCIGRLLEKGYRRDHVLMIGDAPGDRDAAKANEVLYYPILVRKERESWKEFLEDGLGRFTDGAFDGEYQRMLIGKFEENLK